ncbi:MAG TPA: hypothetical protein P5075_04815 [Eubacteriales bacterium]|nr:hypothetical protein [Eubacteriales bacterium]
MAWYWWALIIAGAAAIIWLKALYVPKWLKKQQLKKQERQKRMEEED